MSEPPKQGRERLRRHWQPGRAGPRRRALWLCVTFNVALSLCMSVCRGAAAPVESSAFCTGEKGQPKQRCPVSSLAETARRMMKMPMG